MLRVVIALAGLATLGFAQTAAAGHSVACASENYKYNECYVGHLDAPAMLQQSSHSACTWNKSWGYNAQTGYIWVGSGCAGTFGDAGGRHHESHYYRSAGNQQEIDPRPQYDRNGEPNFDTHGNYQGCHGLGCEVDTPAQEPVDTRPQFDKNGEPNFDAHGNYQGCHGDGCDVDTPPDNDDGGDH